MRLIFETFDRTGSAMQTAKLFGEQGLRFPRRIRKGTEQGRVALGAGGALSNPPGVA